MEPVSTLILTIGSLGGKYLGAGKFVTAIKLIIAGKKVAAVAVAAKGALVEEAIVHSFKELTNGNMIINQDPTLINLPDSSFNPSNFTQDNLIIDNSVFDNQVYSPQFNYPKINSDHFHDLTFDNNDFVSNTTHGDLLEKIQDVYGQDVAIRSIVRQVGNDYTPIYLADDIGQNYSSLDISNAANIKFPKETLEWIDQTELEDAQLEYDAGMSNSAPSTSTSYDRAQSIEPTTHDAHRYHTVNDILNSNEYTDAQKEDIIARKLTIQYEVLTKDKEYMFSLTTTQRDVCNNFPDFLKEHELKLDKDKEIIEILNKKGESKEIIKEVAKTVEECKAELQGKPMSEKIYMALSLLSISIAIPVVIKKAGDSDNTSKENSNLFIIEKNEKPESKTVREKKEEAEKEDQVDPILRVTQAQIRAKIAKGKMEKVLKLFVDKLPEDHSLYKSFMLLQTRFKRHEKLHNEGLITKNDFTTEVQNITMSILIFVEEYFSDDEDEW